MARIPPGCWCGGHHSWMRWDGATAVITGASGGIGRAVAVAAVERGARVGLVARSGEKLAALRDRLGGPAVVSIAIADLTDAAQLEQAFATVGRELGSVDVLVNNAGIGSWGPFVDTPDRDLDRVVALNLVAAMRLTRLVLPGMIRRRRGHIVNVGSVAGRLGAPFEAVYSASKFGLTGFTEALAVELRPFGIGVSMVNPGPVATAFTSAAAAHRAVRWPRPVAPERVAKAVVSIVEDGRLERVVPRWLRLAHVLRTIAPVTYTSGAPRAVADQLAAFERRWTSDAGG
jgi:short-subunit dehydrogenase